MYKDAEKQKAWVKAYRAKNIVELRAKARSYMASRPRCIRQENNRRWAIKVKTETLTHYGPNQTLQCCWPECAVVDIDVLSLDHVNDNGKEHRKVEPRTGVYFYAKLIKQGFPPEYQTLCMNHQLKKEITRRRRLAKENGQ